MLGYLWDRIPAPWWIKTLLALVVVAAIVLVCFQFVFPWAQDYFNLTDNTVS